MDIKENFAKNLIRYRKTLKLTQAEFAEKINYSDKAVSKWERGESVPDLAVVKNIADLFGVSVDALITEEYTEKPKHLKNLVTKRALIYLAVAAFVWLLAISVYTLIDIIFPSMIGGRWQNWLAFIYAIPVTAFVLLIFASVYKNKIMNIVLLSVFFWSMLLAIFLSINILVQPAPEKLWEIFLIGVPLQGLVLFLFFYKKVK